MSYETRGTVVALCQIFVRCFAKYFLAIVLDWNWVSAQMKMRRVLCVFVCVEEYFYVCAVAHALLSLHFFHLFLKQLF